MARGQLESVLRELRTTLVAKSAEHYADAELLDRFALGQDDIAFTVLVKRYGRLVLNVCRHVLRVEADAEDAFQATFLILARRAATIRKQAALACWFHRVAYRCAQDVRRSAMRRQQREKAANGSRVPESAAAAASLNELQALLDAEIERLPEKYRVPFILCCLEGKSRADAAQALSWKEGTVSGRLAKAREILQKRLLARGVTLSAALGAVALSPEMLSAASPMALTHRTIDAALAFAAGGAAEAVSGQAALVAQGILKSMLFSKLKFAVILTLAASLTAFAVGGFGRQSQETDAAEITPPNTPAQAADGKPAPGDENESGVPVRVVFQGKPVAGAQVWVFGHDRYSDKTSSVKETRLTDAAGEVRIPDRVFANRSPSGLHLFVRDAEGRVAGSPFPPYSQHTAVIALDMLPTTDVTGRVHGVDGKPLAGIEVGVDLFAPRLENQNKRRGIGASMQVPPWDADTQKKITDKDGRFTLTRVPAGLFANLRLKGAGYGESRAVIATDKPAPVTLAATGSIRVVFRGVPAAETNGMHWRFWNNSAIDWKSEKFHSNSDADWVESDDGGFMAYHRISVTFNGTTPYVVKNVPPGSYHIVASNYNVPFSAKTDIEPIVVQSGETADVVLELTKLAKMTGRVVDAETGKPAAGVHVRLYPRDPKVDKLMHAGFVETDADGRYVHYAHAGFEGDVEITAGIGVAFGNFVATENIRGKTPRFPVKLTASGHSFPDITVRRSAPFQAVIVDEQDKPTQATVYLADSSGYQSHALFVSGKNGTIRIPGADPEAGLTLRVRRGESVNVPTAMAVGVADQQKLRLSKENAFFVDGRVTDMKGKPIAGASVILEWMFPMGKSSPGGYTSRLFDIGKTDAEGRFRSPALWAGDYYWVNVTAPGYGKAESKQVKGAVGKTATFPVQLVASALAVKGRVVDTAGKPLANVRVFNRGDGELPMATDSDSAGQFTLNGYLDGPAFVCAIAPGYRLLAAPVDPGGDSVTLTLRKTSEAPAQAPDLAKHKAEIDKLTQKAFELMWRERAILGRYERSVFDAFARFDPPSAKKAAEQTHQKDGSDALLKRFERIVETSKLLDIAKADPEEAIALLASRKGSEGYHATIRLASQLRPIDAKKALRICEEAVLRARGLDMPDRVAYLAESGYVVARSGNREGGKAIIIEAADMAEKLPDSRHAGWAKANAASYLAPFDEARALPMIVSLKEEGDRDFQFANAINQVAAFDLDAGQNLLERFPKGGLSFARDYARIWVAMRLAQTNLDAAVKVLAGGKERTYRTLGYVKLAQMVGAKDKSRAWPLLDKALNEYEIVSDTRHGEHDSGSGMGGRPVELAHVAAAGRALNYPDVSGAIARVIADRPTGPYEDSPQRRDSQRIQIALALSFSDPASARRVLASVAAPENFVKTTTAGERLHLFASAFVLPERTAPLIATGMQNFRSGNSSLVVLFDALTAKNRLHAAANWAGLIDLRDDWKE